MARIVFDQFHTYDQITTMLEQWTKDFPHLCRLSSAGLSPQGREQWVLELTNYASGEAAEKPAYFINGNTHAGEVSGCAACLYTIQELLLGYGSDPLCTHVLDTRTVYIMPRITMDGSEYYLTTPHSVRSAARPYPDEEQADGLYPEDVNGDGHILQMRWRDPHGEWKVSERDPRIMVKRLPDDFGGEYYRLFPEGMIKNYDGVQVKVARPQFGLDFNRNFAANWAPEHRQPGAGAYPFSEPETKNVADFMLKHKNIGGTLAYHTAVGVFLRPFEHLSDDKMPEADLELYKTFGYMGKAETDFPLISIFQDLTWDQSKPTVGSFPDWAYAHLGIVALEIELWDLPKQAGLEHQSLKMIKQRTPRDEEDVQLKLLEWNDRELDGSGFINWHSFVHPQLGEVEIGGWNRKYVNQNPPTHMLEDEIRGSARYTIRHAASSPRLEIEKVNTVELAQNVHKVQLIVVNSGFLATNITEMALSNKTAKPVEVKLELGEGLSLSAGQARTELGHIPGFAKRQAEWVVSGKGRLDITVLSDKGGVVRTSLEL